MKKNLFLLVAASAVTIVIGAYLRPAQQAEIETPNTLSKEDTSAITAIDKRFSGDVKIKKKHPKDSQKVLDISPLDIADHEISPFPDAVKPLGLASIFPTKPEDLYLNNIKAAKNGDAESQFLVGRALRECKSYVAQERLNELRFSNKYPHRLIIDLQAQKLKCDALAKIVPPKQLNAWDTHYKWMKKSFEGGAPLAAVWHLSDQPQLYNESDVLAIISTAQTMSATDQRYLISQMSFITANFFGESENRSTAWEYAACQTTRWCDENVMEAYIRHYELPHTADNIVSESQIIVDAIRASNIQKIVASYVD